MNVGSARPEPTRAIAVQRCARWLAVGLACCTLACGRTGVGREPSDGARVCSGGWKPGPTLVLENPSYASIAVSDGQLFASWQVFDTAGLEHLTTQWLDPNGDPVAPARDVAQLPAMGGVLSKRIIRRDGAAMWAGLENHSRLALSRVATDGTSATWLESTLPAQTWVKSVQRVGDAVVAVGDELGRVVLIAGPDERRVTLEGFSAGALAVGDELVLVWQTRTRVMRLSRFSSKLERTVSDVSVDLPGSVEVLTSCRNQLLIAGREVDASSAYRPTLTLVGLDGRVGWTVQLPSTISGAVAGAVCARERVLVAFVAEDDAKRREAVWAELSLNGELLTPPVGFGDASPLAALWSLDLDGDTPVAVSSGYSNSNNLTRFVCR